MAKRFTDTEKWKKQFIKSLGTVNKLLFLYILDDCDHAGIWHVEIDIAEMRIGEKIDLEEAKAEFKDHIIEFDNGEKWFIPYFIEFQYGELNENVKAHKSVIDKLNKYNLIEQFGNSLFRVMDKEKEKDMDKDKEEECDISNLSKEEKQARWDRFLISKDKTLNNDFVKQTWTKNIDLNWPQLKKAILEYFKDREALKDISRTTKEYQDHCYLWIKKNRERFCGQLEKPNYPSIRKKHEQELIKTKINKS